MITTNGHEANLNNCINSIVRARAIDGSRKDVRIVQHVGNVTLFNDEKGNKYELPENVKLKVFSAGLGKISLKEIWEEFGSEWVTIEDYLGERITISIQGISNQKYGWVSESITFQEGNLIINSLDEAAPIEINTIDQTPLELPTQVQAEQPATPSFDVESLKED